MKQVLEIWHHDKMLVRMTINGEIESAQVEGDYVRIVGRPDLVKGCP